MKSITRLIYAAALTAAAALAVDSAIAAPFIPGNIVVLQEGDGSVATSTASSPVFLLEFLPATASQGLPVQTIALPATGASRLTQSSGSASEGFLTRSINSSNITFVGYDAPIGIANVPGTSANGTNRCWGQVDFNGNFTRGASGSSTAYSGSNIRSSVSDGTNYWMSGTASTAANGGIWYSANGAAWTEIIAAGGNFRVTRIFNGRLYYDNSTTLSAFGGMPASTATAAATGITGSSLYDFAINPAGNVAYVCDDTSAATAISKWTNNGSAWARAFTFGASNSLTAGCRSLAVDFSGANPVLYSTTADAPQKLIRITDTSALTAITNVTDQATPLAVAPTNTAFRGVALAPVSSSTGTAPSINGISPASLSVNVGGTAAFTLSGGVGYPAASNHWYVVTSSTPNLLSDGVQGSGSGIRGALTGTLTLTNVQPSDTAAYFAILTNASGSVTSSVVTLNVTASPTIAGISPAGITTYSGGLATFTLTATTGTPTASNLWYKIVDATTNLIASQTGWVLALTNVTTADAAGYFAILTNASGSATSSVVTLSINDTPSIFGISPVAITNNAGSTVTFTLATGAAPATNNWYQVVGTTTNLIVSTMKLAGATNAALTLRNVLGGDTAGYFATLTNVSGLATSAMVSLTVTNDPNITRQPAGAFGLQDGTVQFSVSAAATSPGYQWYFTDANGNIIAPVSSGTQGSGSVVTGATTRTLTIANLQNADPTNLVVVITNAYGAVTSSVASLLSVNTSGSILAFWNFNTPTNGFNNASPAPYFGNGTASLTGLPAFTTTVQDPDDGLGLDFPYGLNLQSAQSGIVNNYTWGTSSYPANNATNSLLASNKLCGVQFNVSTAGAKNIAVSYDSRVSPTASDYERLQYTTNGTTWIDYPTSSTFGGVSGSGNGGFLPFSYSLAGFPGVANNPDFGIRVVTEFQSTATYGNSTNANYLGTANTYGPGGTVTYDIVTLCGDAITNSYAPPAISSFADTNMVDTNTLTLNFTVESSTTPSNLLTVTAVSLDSSRINPDLTLGGSGTNRTLTISFAGNYIPDPMDAAPIQVTVTDTNGDSSVAWFDLTVRSLNLPPTNSLTSLATTNTLANTPITIPFMAGDDGTPLGGLTYAVVSGNNTVVPTANIIVNGQGTANPSVTITPAANQVGVATISVSVSDNATVEPRTTTANLQLMVRPNTNIVLVDYFNYDNSGALDQVAGGLWNHLTGNYRQIQVSSGVVTVDTQDNSENMQAQLLGAPYLTNSGACLYASFTVNMDPARMPITNGTYFALFNDGSGVTGPYEGRVMAATNGAAPGFYRLGINNFGADAASGQMFPLDLSPNSNYIVVVSLVLSNGFSTLWINPTNQASLSVTDTTAASGNLYNISDFELRESGKFGGSVSLGSLLVGPTFDSVFFPPVANPDAYAITENTVGNVFNPLANDVSGGTLNLVDLSPDGNGTAAISGTNITFTPAVNFIGTATIGYTIQDNLGNTNSSTLTVTVTNIPPLANPDSYTVLENSANNVFNPLTNDVVETPGGSLSLVSISPNKGTAMISGNQVSFTPTANFVGTAIIGYTVTDNVGGTNSAFITVAVGNVTPIPVSAQVSDGKLVLSWSNPTFSLQTSTNVAGPYSAIPGATSPYTNLITTNAAGFFRLMH